MFVHVGANPSVCRVTEHGLTSLASLQGVTCEWNVPPPPPPAHSVTPAGACRGCAPPRALQASRCTIPADFSPVQGAHTTKDMSFLALARSWLRWRHVCGVGPVVRHRCQWQRCSWRCEEAWAGRPHGRADLRVGQYQANTGNRSPPKRHYCPPTPRQPPPRCHSASARCHSRAAKTPIARQLVAGSRRACIAPQLPLHPRGAVPSGLAAVQAFHACSVPPRCAFVWSRGGRRKPHFTVPAACGVKLAGNVRGSRRIAHAHLARWRPFTAKNGVQ